MPTQAEQAVLDYVAAQTTINDAQDAAVAVAVANVATAQTNVQAMVDLIAKLQASQGDTWTPADQANLDALTARGNTTLTGITTLGTNLQTLDNMTNPPPPMAAAVRK